jgi:hypothetical protein
MEMLVRGNSDAGRDTGRVAIPTSTGRSRRGQLVSIPNDVGAMHASPCEDS